MFRNKPHESLNRRRRRSRRGDGRPAPTSTSRRPPTFVAFLGTTLLLLQRGGRCESSTTAAASTTTVLGVLHPHSATGYATLVAFALVLTVVGWIACLYPLVFVPKFRETLAGFERDGVSKAGTVVRVRRARVFNPFRYVGVPSRHYHYVTVKFANVNGDKMRKTMCLEEGTRARIGSGGGDDRSSSMSAPAIVTGSEVTVHCLRDYPRSGCLGPDIQGLHLSARSKFAYLVSSAFILGLGFWSSLVSPSKVLFSSVGLWKFWLVLLGHGASCLLAYWACNFAYRNRVEDLLYDAPPFPGKGGCDVYGSFRRSGSGGDDDDRTLTTKVEPPFDEGARKVERGESEGKRGSGLTSSSLETHIEMRSSGESGGATGGDGSRSDAALLDSTGTYHALE